MSQTPFRSVGQQRRTEATNVKRSAPDRSAQTNELARQQKLQFDNLERVINIDQKLQLANDQVLSDAEIRNQQLVMAQLSDNLQFSQEARKLRQSQGLEDQKMLDDFDRQILNLRNAEQVTANDIKQQQSINQLNSITTFGESLLNFSSTLTKKNIEEQNQANRQLQAKGQFDALMRRAGNPETNLTQAQDARAAIGTDLNLKANELEGQGLDNDATQLRSNNAFYRFGFQEGLALKAANGFQGSLNTAITEFIENGQLYGSKDALVKVQQFIRNFSIDYIDKNGLQALPEEILNAYFTKPMLVAQSKAIGTFNETNNRVTKDLAVGTGINKLTMYVTATSTSALDDPEFRETVSKELLGIVAVDPVNAQRNLMNMYKSIYSDTRYSEDPSKSGAVMRVLAAIKADANLSPYYSQIYSQFQDDEKQRDNRIEKAAEDAEKEQAELFINNLRSKAQSTSTNEGINDLKQSAYLDPMFLNATGAEQDKMRRAIQDLGPKDSASIQIAVAEFEESNPTAEQREQFVKDNAGYGPEFVETQMAKARVQRQVIKQYKDTLDIYKAKIANTIPKVLVNSSNKLEFGADKKYEALILKRKNILEQRFNAWFQTQQSTPDQKKVKDWFETQEDLYTEVEQKNLNNELNGNSGERDGTSIKGTEGAPQGTYSGGTAFNYTGQSLRNKAVSGRLGTLDPTEGVFLTQSEVIYMTEAYEKNGSVGPVLQDLVDNSNVTVEEFLEGQAKIFNMPGSVVKPGTQFRGVWNETTSVRSYYSNLGYSKTVSIAWQSAYTFFNKGKDEIFPLTEDAEKTYQDFAKYAQFNPKDPNTRMNFFDALVKRHSQVSNSGSRAHQILNSTNPTVNQLVEAMGFIFQLDPSNKEIYKQLLNQSL
jgi:hypothetical protein